MTRQMTQRGISFLRNEEGERLEAYDDATGKAVPPGGKCIGTLTIGVGHTGPDVFPGQKITKQESAALFDADTDRFERCVELACVGPKNKPMRPNDNEFDAMVSLAFNIGEQAFKGSSVVRMWNAGDRAAAGEAFNLWVKSRSNLSGKLEDHPVLKARRKREMALFFEPMPSELPKPMPQAVEPPAGATSNNTVKTVAGAVAVPAATVAVENAKPAIEAVREVADAVGQARSAMDAVKEALSIFANGHFLTALLMAVILGAAIYIGFRIWRRIRNGEVKA